MEFNNDVFWSEKRLDKHLDEVPALWRNEEGPNLTEDDLQLNLLGSVSRKPVREGQPMGGQNFGKNNITCAANDKNNPSQYAGNTNAYLSLTEPLEEHPENVNFKVKNQDGRPDYDKAQPRLTLNSIDPKPEKVERGNGENDRPHKGDSYQEEQSNSETPNIAGPNEVPDQQKVGEQLNDDDREHIET